ncbi:MAG: alpha/beta fold hydrolase [Acidimicrobiales bacterium]
METIVHRRRVRIATGGCDLSGTDPAVVLVHGAGGDRTAWQLQTRWLAHHGYRAVAADLPGHGRSEGPALGSIAAMAEWLVDLIAVLDLGRAHLVGHSMGSFVALEASRNRPEAVASLVLLGTAGTMPVHADLLAAARADDPVAARLITSWGLGSRAHHGGHESPGMWLIGGNLAQLDLAPEGALGADLGACEAYEGALDAARALTCPVTFVLGREDRMTPNRRAADLIEAVADSHLVRLERIGHFPHLEAPIAARRAIAEALARTRG